MPLDDKLLNRLFRAKASALRHLDVGQADSFQTGVAVARLYSHIGLKSPKVFFADDPYRGVELLEHLKGLTQSLHQDINSFGIFENSQSIANLIKSIKHTEAAALQKNLIKSFDTETFSTLYRILFWDFNFRFVRCAQEPIDEAVDGLCAKSKHSSERSFSAFLDADWLLFYQVLNQEGLLEANTDSPFLEFLCSGGYELRAFEDFAIIVMAPRRILQDEAYLLHNEDTCAVEWQNGLKLYFWKGVQIPSQLIENPEAVTRNDILSETNVEIRRCYQEVLGSSRFAELLDLITIDRSVDRYGHDQLLLRTADIDKLAGDYIYFVQVTCPSTARKYMLCVPPGMRKAEAAVAWTFGKKANDYRPTIET